MIRINNIKITPCENFRLNDIAEKGFSKAVLEEIRRLVLKKIKVSEKSLVELKIYKMSIDARRKDDVKVVFSVNVSLKEEKVFLKKCHDKDVSPVGTEINQYKDFSMDDPEKTLPGLKRNSIEKNSLPGCKRNSDKKLQGQKIKIVVVGAGPAGLFCALRLAEAGLKPLLLERGEDVDNRMKTVGEFWQGKPLNPSSNVQFGEGGAGTFSDGKLNTMVKDREGYMKQVYRIFVENGADESIQYINKPHIGTDKLTEIVKSIRKRIIALGGEVRFSSQVTDIHFSDLDEINNTSDTQAKIIGVSLADGTEQECDKLVLALGHSARDTFEMLVQKGVHMEQKPFAIGVRVQHPRDFIDKAQYGDFAKYLPAADYKLTYTKEGKRSVYSFCMCPGGYVVNASSEEGRLAVNGMSYSSRDGNGSNAAIVVQVGPEDYPGKDPLAGMRLQRKLEEEAFNVCKGKIPVQKLGSFVKHVFLNRREFIEKYNSTDESSFVHENAEGFIAKICGNTVFFDEILPECRGQWEFGDLNNFLPTYITESLLEAFPEFGKSIKGYNSKNTLLLGLESRTSSPVRICRGEDLQSVNVSGLYPCGEGAGFAGGITSAAMDGLKVADKIIENQSE